MTKPTRYDTFAVPVPGGELGVGRWRGDAGAPVVIVAHGITGSHLSWAEVANHLDGAATLVAPDLRGRGVSNGLPGPFGMAAHARDIVAVMDHLDVERSVLAGHSMGGYVATVTAMQYPDRVGAVVLADGGIALELPVDFDLDAVIMSVIGPGMTRLQTTFASRAAYRDFWRAHPAVGPWWSPVVEAYVDYDVEGDEPQLRSRVTVDAVRADSDDTIRCEDARVAITKIACPAVLLRAERGMLDQPPGLITDDVLAAVGPNAPNLVATSVVPGTNHYTLLLAPHGAAAVAAAIREFVTRC